MSLKVVSRAGTDRLYLRGTVRGQSIFESAGTSDPQKAEAYRAKREAELWTESVYGKRAVVTFAHALTAYLEAEERSETTKAHLRRLLDHFGTTRLTDINQAAVDKAYGRILTSGRGASPATKLRGVLTPLKAVLEFAARRQWCERPAFERPKVAASRTIYLRPAEVDALIDAAADHLKPLLIFLAGTGVRMSEALDLEWRHVDLKGSRAVVWQKQGTERHVDLPLVVIIALDALDHREGHVFRPVRTKRPAGARSGKEVGERYHNNGRTSGGQIKNGWARACRDAELPGHWREWIPKGTNQTKRTWVPEVTPHDLRHTWATWHYCLHRDLLALREDGGWSTITMVTRYAKKMPDAYASEIRAWLDGKTQGVQNPCSDNSDGEKVAVYRRF